MLQFVRFIRKDAPIHSPSNQPRYGIIKAFHWSEGGEKVMVLQGNPFEKDLDAPDTLDELIPTGKIQCLAPVIPSKIVGVGYNYRDKAAEQGTQNPEVPYIFLKSPGAVTDPGGIIRLNRHCQEVHFESELAVIIGRQCSAIREDQADRYIAGYTIANDVTERVIQKQERSLARAKSMDTFCPLGPYLVRGTTWQNKKIRTWINGELVQTSSTDDMIHGVAKLVSFVSEFMTLMPGDVIITGAAAGTRAIKAGDKVKIEIDQLGCLENAVEHEL